MTVANLRLLRPFAVVLVLLLAMAGSASAQRARYPLERAVVTLDNGEHVWRDDDAGGGEVRILVSIPSQMMLVYRDGQVIAASTVSTGKRGKSTPTGTFTILQKKIFHRSNIYSNAPMPFMQRLTWTGIAIHAGKLPGYPASHGCIRLPRAFAARLFSVTSMGAVVVVTAERIDPDVMIPMPAPRLPPVTIARAFKPAPVPVRIPEPLPAPIIPVRAVDYDSERFNIVTFAAVVVPSPGQPVFGPSRAVVQPTGYRRKRRR